MNGIPVARLFGIEVRIHLSWIFIIAIITVTVGGRLNVVEPTFEPMVTWLIGAIASLGFLVTVVIHELAHALVARRTGTPVEAISVHFVGGPAAVEVAGTLTRKIAPPSGSFSAQIRPPYVSTIDRLMESPTPSPSPFVLKNDANTC